MRIKLFMLAFAAALAASTPAQAAAILGFGVGPVQPPAGLQPDPNYPGSPPGSNIDPNTLVGLSDFTFGTSLLANNSAGNPLHMAVGAKFIVQIQMTDTTPFTFANTATARMFQWATRLNYVPGVVSATADPNPLDNVSNTLAVNDSTGSPQSNIAGANNNTTANSFGIGNIFLTPWVTANGTAPHFYALANVILTANGAGLADISMSDLNPATADFTNSVVGSNFDSVIYAPANLPNYHLFIQVDAVPEPSSMVLAGLVASGLGYRLRRKKVAEVKA